MGMLEELWGLASSLPDYGGTGMNLSPEERQRLIEERMRSYQSQVQGYDLSPQLTPFGESLFGVGGAEGAGSEMLGETGAGKSPALEKVKAARMAAEEAEETERLQASAMQSSLDPYSWLSGKGGETPAGKLEKLRKIREQAGGTPGGGTFSQGTDSPELQARLAERDEWTAGQPERDLEFMASAEQARRSPELAISAAEQLKGLRAAKVAERQVANQEALVEAVKSTGGKVPFEIANQLDVAGFEVPWSMRGLSPDRAKENINAVVANAAKDIQDPMTAPQEAQYLEWIISLAPQYQGMIDAGMDPDEAWDRFDALVKRGAAESGAIESYMNRTRAQQPTEG